MGKSTISMAIFNSYSYKGTATQNCGIIKQTAGNSPKKRLTFWKIIRKSLMNWRTFAMFDSRWVSNKNMVGLPTARIVNQPTTHGGLSNKHICYPSDGGC
jgi:hypothetical protein